MLKIKRKSIYLRSSIGVAMVALVTLAGAASKLLDGFGVFADTASDLPACTDIQAYSYANYDRHDTVSGPISLTEDTHKSYVIPDQTEACAAVFNLNGYTLSGVWSSDSNGLATIEAGNNVTVIINGAGGTIDQKIQEEPSQLCYTQEMGNGQTMTTCESGRSAVLVNFPSTIMLPSGSTAIINDTTLSALRRYDVENRGVLELNNVASSAIITYGDTTVNSDTYSSLATKAGGTTTINGGTVSDLSSETGANVVINGGTIESNEIKSQQYIPISGYIAPNAHEPSNTNDITVNGGTYNGTTFSSPVTLNGGTYNGATVAAGSVITGGTFVNTEIAEGTEISGGNFDTAPELDEISEGKKVVKNDDGTYSVVDITPDEPDDNTDDNPKDSTADDTTKETNSDKSTTKTTETAAGVTEAIAEAAETKETPSVPDTGVFSGENGAKVEALLDIVLALGLATLASYLYLLYTTVKNAKNQK